MFSGIDKTMLFGNDTDLIFPKAAKRKFYMCQLFLGQHIEHIGLILGVVHCFFQKIASSVLIIFHSCVMSGYNIIVADLLHTVEHFVKFQITVTVDTWIGCASVFVGLHKTIHNFCMEICGKIKYVVRHIHLISHASGILHIVQGTTGLFPVDTDIFVVVKFHGSADALVTGFLC